VEDVATRMLEHGASRLPVLRHGRLIGIVARSDLLRLLVVDRSTLPGLSSTSSPAAISHRDQVAEHSPADPDRVGSPGEPSDSTPRARLRAV